MRRQLIFVKRHLFAAAAILAASGGALAQEAMPLTQGAMLSNSCAACHGTDGMSPGAMPSIGVKSAGFIEQALKDFRDGKRTGTVMNRHATGYSDEEIRQIAEFFGQPQ